MKKLFYLPILTLFSVLSASAQLNLPRDSQRQEIAQIVGDTRVAIVYHRPNTKGRKNIFGCESTDVVPKGGVNYPCLVPYGQVWRAGANENTTFEVTNDVTIGGQKLPAGKYGLHMLPSKNDWVLIFSKDNDKWGSYSYDATKDQVRVPVKAVTADMTETLSYDFENVTANTAQVTLRWEKVAVPFTVDVGDVHGRVLTQVREAIKNRKADDFRVYNQGAGYVLAYKVKNNYEEAVGWLDESIKARETFGALSTKARILAEMGRTAEAVTTAEKAIQVGKAAQPAANTAELEGLVAEWKAKK
ncbi:MAG TPA: DUF2911 domain-containing protein [Pyrinomonadaceae bacterium]|jgi:hypothetical protein